MNELPPSAPARLKDAEWLEETFREDRLLVDPALFDVVAYRGRKTVQWLIEHIGDWNQESTRSPLLFNEYNWAEQSVDGLRWRRAYANPIDGTHRAAAAQEVRFPTWITVLAYHFEREAVEQFGLTPDRDHLRPWLVPEGAPPRPRHEVETLPSYEPKGLLANQRPTVDGLLGFGDEGGVMRIRVFEAPGRVEFLFSTVRNGLGPTPCSMLSSQLEAMSAIWRRTRPSLLRHPWDAEWWMDDAGTGRQWQDARIGIDVVLEGDDIRFVECADTDDEGPDLAPGS